MKINIINVPLDYGAGVRGTNVAPQILFNSGLLSRLQALGHDIVTETSAVEPCPVEPENSDAKHLDPIHRSCVTLADRIIETMSGNAFPLIIGGDHSTLLGTLAGVSRHAQQQGKRIGVIYVDAHGDFNTPESSPTGNIHGMCLAASCGIGLDKLVNLHHNGPKVNPHNVYIIGARDLDATEKVVMRNAGVHVRTAGDIAGRGLNAITDEVITDLTERCDAIHLSFDIDSVDPVYAPGTAIHIPGGLTSREAITLMEKVYKCGKLSSADFVELNPFRDENNRTANLIVTLIAHLLGETYY